MVGFALATGCVVKSGDDDGGEGGEGNEGAESSGGSSNGGSSTGGRGGTSTGGSATGGSATGGSATGGSATGGSATGGSATGGSATGGMDTDPECDPDMGELDNTYYPDCNATPGNSCEECIQESCCEQSRICYGYDPGNVCGWGGPEGDGEITCYIACAQDYVEANGVFDDDGIDECTTECTTAMCGQIGNATQDLAICLQENCEEACWPAE
jgi:hypothetical protein